MLSAHLTFPVPPLEPCHEAQGGRDPGHVLLTGSRQEFQPDARIAEALAQAPARPTPISVRVSERLRERRGECFREASIGLKFLPRSRQQQVSRITSALSLMA